MQNLLLIFQNMFSQTKGESGLSQGLISRETHCFEEKFEVDVEILGGSENQRLPGGSSVGDDDTT